MFPDYNGNNLVVYRLFTNAELFLLRVASNNTTVNLEHKKPGHRCPGIKTLLRIT
jgi:hypothetical protein